MTLRPPRVPSRIPGKRYPLRTSDDHLACRGRRSQGHQWYRVRDLIGSRWVRSARQRSANRSSGSARSTTTRLATTSPTNMVCDDRPSVIRRTLEYDPAEMAARGRIEGLATRSRHDSKDLTRAGRAAFLSRFEHEVDPEGAHQPDGAPGYPAPPHARHGGGDWVPWTGDSILRKRR